MLEPTVKKKATRKKAVKKQTKATAKVKHEDTINKYYNGTSINIFLPTGRVPPTGTCMLTELEAINYEGLFKV